MRHLLFFLLTFWPTTGLAVSPIPTEIYAEVDHGLRPARVLADPVGYHGRALLLGGIVDRTVSEPGRVSLEVTCYGLTDDDRPEARDPSLGRVLVTGPQLDGGKLQPGRLITLVGEVGGQIQVDAVKLPLLIAKFIHPWPTAAEEEAARATSHMRGDRYDPWCGPWRHDPLCDPWYYGPYPRWRFGGSYCWHRH